MTLTERDFIRNKVDEMAGEMHDAGVNLDSAEADPFFDRLRETIGNRFPEHDEETVIQMISEIMDKEGGD